MIVSHVHHYACSIDKLQGWQAPARDPSTNAPVPDPSKFPNGVKDLADKIHAMGLKVLSDHRFICPIKPYALVWNIQ